MATAAELAATEGAETEAKEETREEANEETKDETKEEAREEEIDDHKSDSEVQVQFTATVKDKEVNTATDDPCRPLRAGSFPLQALDVLLDRLRGMASTHTRNAAVEKLFYEYEEVLDDDVSDDDIRAIVNVLEHIASHNGIVWPRGIG